MLRKFLIGSAGLTLAAGISVAVWSDAKASTPGCTTGAWAGYCGTQTDAESPAMSWDVYKQRAAVGNKLIAWPDSDTDRAVDFVAVKPGTNSDGNAKFFVYAPDGQVTNLCVSEPSPRAGLVLAQCNGSAFQVFTAVPIAGTDLFEWVNKASGDVVAAVGIRSQLTGEAPPSTPGPGVEWSFTS